MGGKIVTENATSAVWECCEKCSDVLFYKRINGVGKAKSMNEWHNGVEFIRTFFLCMKIIVSNPIFMKEQFAYFHSKSYIRQLTGNYDKRFGLV